MTTYPPINLDHLHTLSDATGVIQHAIFSIPNRKSGYTTDDNSRALGVAAQCSRVADGGEARRLVSTYLSFLHYAQRRDGWFQNFLTYDQNFVDREGSEDCFGRSVRACAEVLGSRLHPNIKRTARHLLERARPRFRELSAPRAKALLLIGLSEIGQALPDEAWPQEAAGATAQSLVALYRARAEPGWRWYEPRFTYCNGLMPWALFAASGWVGDAAGPPRATATAAEGLAAECLSVAEESLEFRHQVMAPGDCLEPVGCEGWYPHGGERARFDQQPVDADSFAQACLAARQATGKEHYSDWALLGLDWFFGRNVHGLDVYDPSTGGCFDGLTPEGLNQNQGAESCVTFLACYLAMIEAGLVTPGTAVAGRG